MEFWRYYRIVRKRRWLIILGMIVCVGLVAFKNYTTQPLYTGRTTLMESMGMSDEGVKMFQEQILQIDFQLRLSNLSQIATSQRVMSNAAQSLAELGFKFSPEEIISNTTVSPVRDTNIIAIEVTLPDPEEAKVAADVIASEFKRVYGEINNQAVKQSREFIEAQVAVARKAMIKAQDELRKFKESNEVTLIDQQSMYVLQRLSQIKSEYYVAKAQRDSARASMARLEKEMREIPEWQLTARSTARDPVWQQFKQQLAELEVRKASYIRLGRMKNHPQMQEVEEQIKEVMSRLSATKENFIAGTNEARNPNHTNVIDRWITAKVEDVSSDARCQAMQSAIEEIRQELKELPEKEAKLAQLMTDVEAAKNTYSLMINKLEEAKIKEQQANDETGLKIIDPAYVFTVNQKKSFKLIMALILSPILGIGVAFLLHYTDNTIKTASDAEATLGLPVISVVPLMRAHSLPRQNCPEIMSVAYQMLTSNLWISSQDSDVNSFVMVSAEPDVGRSVTASNLAVSLAREGARVILVDSDFRQPTQHLIFGLDNKAGLSNILSGAATLEDALAVTKIQGLLVLPTGPVPDNPVKLLRSAEMKELTEQVKDLADFVIYDTPAAVAFPDPILVAAHVGNAIMVHSAGRVSRGSEKELIARLQSVGVTLLGAVLNKVKKEDSSGYFHYRRSYAGVQIARLPGGSRTAS